MQIVYQKQVIKIQNTKPIDRWPLWLPIVSAALGVVAGALAWFNQARLAAVCGVLAGALSAASVVVTSEASRRRDQQMASYFEMLEFTHGRLSTGGFQADAIRRADLK